MKGRRVKQLGDILLEGGLVSPTQLEAAYEEQQRVGRALGRVLIEQGVLTESQLVAALATQIGLRFVDLVGLRRRRLRRRPRPGHGLPPALRDADRLRGRQAARRDGRPRERVRDRRHPVADRHGRQAGGRHPGRRRSRRSTGTTAPTPTSTTSPPSWTPRTEEDDLSKVKEIVEDAPIVKYVNLLITQAIQDRASDIHLEPTEHDLRVRFRIDGVLHEVMRSPKAIQSGVISRLKIMADINIAERRIPQDGRLSVNAHGRKIDLRVATLPTVWGEKVVMRILDNSTARLDLTDLGFSEDNYERYSRQLHQALRHDPGHRPDRLRQVDDAVRDAEHRQPARGQRHHRRGPGGVPARRASTRCR